MDPETERTVGRIPPTEALNEAEGGGGEGVEALPLPESKPDSPVIQSIAEALCSGIPAPFIINYLINGTRPTMCKKNLKKQPTLCDSYFN
jgi:hypothetical protein